MTREEFERRAARMRQHKGHIPERGHYTLPCLGCGETPQGGRRTWRGLCAECRRAEAIKLNDPSEEPRTMTGTHPMGRMAHMIFLFTAAIALCFAQVDVPVNAKGPYIDLTRQAKWGTAGLMGLENRYVFSPDPASSGVCL